MAAGIRIVYGNSMANENLACLLNGHKPTGVTLNTRTTCCYCHEPLYYVGDIFWDEQYCWKTKEEMDKTNGRPTGFDPDYP